jgi:hypothetical protein
VVRRVGPHRTTNQNRNRSQKGSQVVPVELVRESKKVPTVVKEGVGVHSHAGGRQFVLASLGWKREDRLECLRARKDLGRPLGLEFVPE